MPFTPLNFLLITQNSPPRDTWQRLKKDLVAETEVAGHVLGKVACQLAHSGWRLKDESGVQLST
ncbi:hypothetical protein Csa_012454 [Cucumis sativus]|uniref:Uncharacterized protein n=1 Tax=Cucumis sativus TaxID=3659 RepID=A0A0A0KZJ0_CUCSA|nr:hypothetical protein Csa_012454 [Cucumis sativus]